MTARAVTAPDQVLGMPSARWVAGPTAFMAFVVLFIGGYNLALPDFSFARPIQVVHGVFIHNVVVMVYLLLMTITGTTRRLFRNTEALPFAALIALLAGLGAISAGVNAYSMYDFGEALRLLLNAAWVLLVVHWARARGGTFVLRSYLAGIATAGILNVYFSLAYIQVSIAPLPVLRAQNGAGGLLAIGVSLGAWLFMIRRVPLDGFIAIASTIVGIVATAFSFSKTAMSICACGLMAWAFVLAHEVSGRRLRILGTMTLALIVGGATYVARSPELSAAFSLVVRAINVKFAGMTIQNKYSVGGRYMYLWGTFDIISEHPVLGVGYTGFYEAIIHTPSYATGKMPDETPEAGAKGEANPHNSFLYYGASNGFPGLVIVIVLFLIFVHVWYQVLRQYGLTGRVMWCGFAFAYFIYGNTLPSMYDTEVLYVPAAVAFAMLAERREMGARSPAEARGRPTLVAANPLPN